MILRSRNILKISVASFSPLNKLQKYIETTHLLSFLEIKLSRKLASKQNASAETSEHDLDNLQNEPTNMKGSDLQRLSILNVKSLQST
jgi:hypothetical protein